MNLFVNSLCHLMNFFIQQTYRKYEEKKVGVAVLESYDKKPQLLTVLLTPDYKELMFKYM